MAENEYKELPVEVRNLHHSKAHKAWAKYVDSDKGKSDSLKFSQTVNDIAEAKELYDLIKANWIDLFKEKEKEKYFQIERAKEAQTELTEAYEEKLADKEKNYQEVMRENARLLTRLQNAHAPK